MVKRSSLFGQKRSLVLGRENVNTRFKRKRLTIAEAIIYLNGYRGTGRKLLSQILMKKGNFPKL